MGSVSRRCRRGASEGWRSSTAFARAAPAGGGSGTAAAACAADPMARVIGTPSVCPCRIASRSQGDCGALMISPPEPWMRSRGRLATDVLPARRAVAHRGRPATPVCHRRVSATLYHRSAAMPSHTRHPIYGDHHKVGAMRLPVPGVRPSTSPGTSDQMSCAARRVRPAYAPGARDVHRAGSTASVAAWLFLPNPRTCKVC